MQFTKEYVIEDIRQLIDINGDLGRFETNFTIKTENPEDVVDVAIVNQQILDEGSEIDYKNIKGEFTNVFKMSGGPEQGYYLVLKADKPTKLVITVNTVPINAPPPMNNPQHREIERPHVLKNDDRKIQDEEPQSMMKSVLDFAKKNQIYIIGGIIILGLVLYYLYSNGYLDTLVDKYNIPFLKKFLVPAPVIEETVLPSMKLKELEEVIPEFVPEVIPEFVPEVIPEVIPEFVPEVIPEVIPEFVPEVELPTPKLTTDSESFLNGLRNLEL